MGGGERRAVHENELLFPEMKPLLAQTRGIGWLVGPQMTTATCHNQTYTSRRAGAVGGSEECAEMAALHLVGGGHLIVGWRLRTVLCLSSICTEFGNRKSKQKLEHVSRFGSSHPPSRSKSIGFGGHLGRQVRTQCQTRAFQLIIPLTATFVCRFDFITRNMKKCKPPHNFSGGVHCYMHLPERIEKPKHRVPFVGVVEGIPLTVLAKPGHVGQIGA